MRCIWCRRDTSSEPLEHVIPDSLGCPDDLVLSNGEVCGRCNGRHTSLDQALTAQFDVARLIANVPNKKGNPPQIAQRPNADGGYEGGRPYINVNMGRRETVIGTQRNLKPFASRPNDLQMRVEDIPAGECKVTITQEGLCNSKTCVRALHKIAFEAFTRRFGAEEALASHFDAVREYVRRGNGERIALLAPGSGAAYQNFAVFSDGSVLPRDVVMFQLAMVCFAVDLSPTQASLQNLKEVHQRSFGDGWTWVPIPA